MLYHFLSAESGFKKKFGKQDCNRARVHILTEPGPVVAFRSDNIVWDFKSLSVREIQPPMQDSSILQFAIFPQ